MPRLTPRQRSSTESAQHWGLFAMRHLRAALAGTASLFISMLIVLGTAYAHADEPAAQVFDIPPQSLAAALKEYAQQSHEEILYSPDIVARKLSSGVRGTMPPLAALNILLKDSGLSYTSRAGGAILVAPPNSAALSPVTESAAAAAEEGKKDSSHDFRVAQVDQGKSSSTVPVSGPASQAQDNSQTSIQEILVTAQKREERLQDVPVPVTAISAATLTDTNQVRLQDYYSSIPGLVISPGIQSSNELAIRGVSPGIGNPTVGLTVDDVPYGASATQEGGLTVPDIDPSDLDHIEVLRGPQGTLYGANAMGGLIKFVTVDPSTQGFKGQIQAGTDTIYNGADLGYTVRGSINVPLSDTFAFRASGFSRQDPGYIDNPILHIDGINKDDVFGGHLSTLWTPSDLFSLKLSALYQDFKGDGLSDVDVTPPLGDLQQNYVQRVGPFSREVEAYSATLKAKLGSVDITSVTGYNINGFHDTFDLTVFFGPATDANYGVTGTPIFETNTTKKFTQEIRLSSWIGSSVEWLLGGFYTHERANFDQTIYGEDPISGPLIGPENATRINESYTEYAGFGDLTVHFTDRFDVQVGGRESHNTQDYAENGNGLLFGPMAVTANSNDSSFTYLLTPRFKISPDLMVYARIASGYRPGGPNNVVPGLQVPLTFEPDTTRNYEIGAKGNVFGEALSFDLSVYHIDWNNIQISEEFNGSGFVGNGGRAKSQGAEFSVVSRPLTGLMISAWIALDDAVLKDDLPPAAVLAGTYGAAGDRLPLSSRFSANLSMQQNFPLWSTVTGFVGGSVSYVGDREGDFVAQGAPRLDLPAYTKTDLRAGAKYDLWTANFYVNNLTDRRALLNAGIFAPYADLYIQPRTVGLLFTRAF